MYEACLEIAGVAEEDLNNFYQFNADEVYYKVKILG